jgi:hypothetical protein
MNFVAHIATGLRAAGYGDDPAFLVGAALPDFASMRRTRLGPAEGALGAGIALHHATDHAFHADGWFLDVERQLRERFRDDGLPDGAARACAHVGPELLLDGALLGDPSIASGVNIVYERIAAPDDDVVHLVPAPERERWRAHLAGVATRLDPFSYGDPVIVAQRLHLITSRRPRLAFDDALVVAVSARLRAVQPHIAASAYDVLDRVSRAVTVTHPRRHWPFRR